MLADNKTDSSQFLRVEYTALSAYFGTVTTFRFTTASFFLAAVALVLRIEDLERHHYLLLLTLSLGIWIVELRNRSLSRNLVQRAHQIERAWSETGRLPFFTHMIPPNDSDWYLDRAQMLWFLLPSMRFITHTVGLDLVYLSVIAYSGWYLFFRDRILYQKGLSMSTMDPIAAVLALALTLAGVSLVKLVVTEDKVKCPWFPAIVGVLLILGTAAIVANAICRAAYPNVGCLCSWFVQKP